jgi:hypothetical protein
LTLPATKEAENIEIRLISIPEDFEGESSDEVMLHISKTDAQPYYDSDFQLKLEDRFDPDKFNFTQTIFSPADSTILNLIFQEYKKNNLPFKIQLQANGIGIWNGEVIIRDEKQNEMNGYPGETLDEKTNSRLSQEFKRLRSSNLFIKIDRELTIKVNSFTDEEERAVGKEDIVPFLLETRLRERGAHFEGGSNFSEKVVADGRLITGQNPQSASALGREIVKRWNQLELSSGRQSDTDSLHWVVQT